MLRLFTYMMILFSSIAPLSATMEKEIITGAFSTPDRAQMQNLKTEAYLGNYPSIAPLLKEKRFYFDVKYYNHNYRSVLTHFKDSDELLTVLNVVKRIYPDAYTSTLSPSLLPPVSQTAATEETMASDSDKTKASQIKPSHSPVAASAKTFNNSLDQTNQAISKKHLPVEVQQDENKPEISTHVSQDDSADIIVIDESHIPEPAADTTQKSSQVLPVHEEKVETKAAPSEQSESAAEMPYLLIAIVAALLIIVLLFIFSRRRKNISSVLNKSQDIDLSNVTEAAFEGQSQKFKQATFEKEVPAKDDYPNNLPSDNLTESLSESPLEPIIPPGQSVPELHKTLRKKREIHQRTSSVSKEDLTDFSGNRILVAEDNLINQKVISKLFEGSGIEIKIANNGQEAIDILNDDPNFNMVLMDAHMPVKDGFEATREIRKNILFEPITVVALSGDVGSDDIRKMKEAGMEEQLSKPLRIEALYDVLYQYLDMVDDAEGSSDEADDAKSRESFGDDSLNKAEGLEICGGDKEMYAEILDDFVYSYASSDKLVSTYIKANDDIKLVALMLDIKGIAANIGADPLSESAETLREAVLINQTEAYENLTQEYSAELHRLLDSIEAYKNSIRRQ